MLRHCFLFSLTLNASPALSATIQPHDISPMDPIGTGCIDGGGYDDPFPSSKAVRAPAFCLPNPCDGALTRTELSRDIIGRPVLDYEWDTYYSRYAELCRADAVNRDLSPEPLTPETFWIPLITPPLLSEFISRSTGQKTVFTSQEGGFGGVKLPVFAGGGSGGGMPPGGTGGSGVLPDGAGGGTSPGEGGSSGGGYTPPSIAIPPRTDSPSNGGGTAGNGGNSGLPPETLPVIPLPLSGLLLMSGIAAIGLRRWLRPPQT